MWRFRVVRTNPCFERIRQQPPNSPTVSIITHVGVGLAAFHYLGLRYFENKAVDAIVEKLPCREML